MRERLHLDVYNVIIASLIPAMLLTAWGLTTVYERNLRREQCEQAITYLQEASELSRLYTTASSLTSATEWYEQMQALSHPEPSNDLHDGALSAFAYGSSVGLEIDPSQPGTLYDELATFQGALDEGRETLISRCPDTEPMIADAFPMYFKDDTTE